MAAKSLRSTANQRPALIAHQLGKGRTLLSAYPLEAWLGSQPEPLKTMKQPTD